MPDNLSDEQRDSWLKDLEVWIGSSDVADCFWRLRIEEEPSAFFGLPGLPAKCFGVKAIASGEVSSDTIVYPCLAALPMGFSWSVFFAQDASYTQLLAAGLKRENALSDRGPSAVLAPQDDAHFYLYIDNAGIIGLEREIVSTSLDDSCKQLDSVGLVTHEVSLTCDFADMLGWRLDCRRKRTRISPKRYHRLYKTIGWILSLPYVPGWMVEALVGHMTFVALCRRPVLSLFHSVYRFVEAYYGVAVPLWLSCRQELTAFRGLMPLIVSEWGAQRSELVSSSDAGPSGWGITHARWPTAEVAAIGRTLERARYRVPGAEKAREHAFAESDGPPEEFSATGLEQEGWERLDDFPEVPLSLLAAERWRVAKFDTWSSEDNILLREARALLYALKRVGRSRKAIGKRILLLVDNMSVCLAFARFRGHHVNMLVIIRKLAAWCLCRRICPSIRWIPSERNSADAPSRYFDFLYHEEPQYKKKVVDSGIHHSDIHTRSDKKLKEGVCPVVPVQNNSTRKSIVRTLLHESSNNRPQDPKDASSAADQPAVGEGEGVVSGALSSEKVDSRFSMFQVDIFQDEMFVSQYSLSTSTRKHVDSQLAASTLSLFDALYAAGHMVDSQQYAHMDCGSSFDEDGENSVYVLELIKFIEVSIQPCTVDFPQTFLNQQDVIAAVGYAAQTRLDESPYCRGRQWPEAVSESRAYGLAPPPGLDRQPPLFPDCAADGAAFEASQAWGALARPSIPRSSFEVPRQPRRRRAASQLCPYAPAFDGGGRLEHLGQCRGCDSVFSVGGCEPQEAVGTTAPRLLRRRHQVQDGRVVDLGGQANFEEGQTQLCSGPGEIYAVRHARKPSFGSRRGGGYGHGGLFRRVLPHGRAGPRGGDDTRVVSGSLPGLQQMGNSPDAKDPEGIARLAQNGASPLSSATRSCLVDGRLCSALQATGVSDGRLHRPQRRVLFEAKRSSAAAQEGPHHTLCLYDLLGLGGERPGDRRAVENLRVRRQLDDRLRLGAVHKADSCCDEGRRPRRAGVHVPLHAVRGRAGPRLRAVADPPHGAVRDAAQRAKPRPDGQVSQLVGGAKARTVENVQKPRPLRKTHPHVAGLERAPGRGSSSCREVSKGSRRVHARPQGGTTAVASERHRRCQDRNRPVLDLFAGSSRVSRAIRRAGFSTKEYELLQGAQYDLTAPSVLNGVCREIRLGVTACMLGPPCSSFSRARDRTRVIRTQKDPWGISSPNLSDSDRKSLSIGNACLRSALRMMRVCLATKTPFILEKPAHVENVSCA